VKSTDPTRSGVARGLLIEVKYRHMIIGSRS